MLQQAHTFHFTYMTVLLLLLLLLLLVAIIVGRRRILSMVVVAGLYWTVAQFADDRMKPVLQDDFCHS